MDRREFLKMSGLALVATQVPLLPAKASPKYPLAYTNPSYSIRMEARYSEPDAHWTTVVWHDDRALLEEGIEKCVREMRKWVEKEGYKVDYVECPEGVWKVWAIQSHIQNMEIGPPISQAEGVRVLLDRWTNLEGLTFEGYCLRIQGGKLRVFGHKA